MSHYKEYENRSNQSFKISDYYGNLKENPIVDGVPNKKSRPSLFNRYSLFFLNDHEANEPMSYIDEPGLWKKNGQFNSNNPSSAQIIRYSQQGFTNAMDYAWGDFIFAKNQGEIKNNHLITLRRFGSPCGDNLFSKTTCPTPDIARMVTWIDGENNKMDDITKFTIGFNWKTLKSEIQSIQSSDYGSESSLFGGSLGKWAAFGIGAVNSADGTSNFLAANSSSFDPYANKANIVLGPVDVIMQMMTRDKGLNFQKDIKLVFEYELRSIDGINPKVAFIDLLSNILICTYNRGEFWGGDVRYYGGPRRRSLLGTDAYDKLASGDWQGFLDQGLSNLLGKFNNISGGGSIGELGKNLLGNIGSMIMGGGMDKMGRPELVSIEALLTGEDTGEWHLTIGNPMNPIMMMGNLILSDTEIKLDGPLGYDDFPTKLIVECTLKPARPRDRSDVMSMFQPTNGRTYVTDPPQSNSYAMNNSNAKGGGSLASTAQATKQQQDATNNSIDQNSFKNRWPNHSNGDDGNSKIKWASQWTTAILPFILMYI